uniref:Uncharacterized protein n=1 Tax=Oryza sativa subsp. japonica TaxID=39947 RepID=Q10GS3_ORYSJ|nr:hypothetical protein LOC_Os03g41932 [Oryza sativa Japonica Group]
MAAVASLTAAACAAANHENADVGASEIFALGGDDLYDYIELEGCKTCTLT